jgi:hypothetical protein
MIFFHSKINVNMVSSDGIMGIAPVPKDQEGVNMIQFFSD